MDNGIKEVWPLFVEANLSSMTKFLSELSIPTIYGKLYGSGHTLIDVGSIGYIEQKETIGSKFTIAVLDVNKPDKESEDIDSISLYLRIGEGNVWLYSNVSNVFSDSESDDEDGGEDGFFYEEIDAELMSRLSYLVATDKNFSSMKNKSQRTELTKNIIEKLELDISEYNFREIASRSESIFEFGVLPKEANKLISSGETLSGAAKALGVTKARLEKALAMKTPDYIETIISKYSNDVG